MSSPKRRRQRARRRARAEAAEPLPDFTDAGLEELMAVVTVRADCEHASTRSTPDGLVLTRCAMGASVAGGCPVDCASFEKRRIGGIGFGLRGGG